jgi:hypothetical protein
LADDGELVLIGCGAATLRYLPPPGEPIASDLVMRGAAGAEDEHFTHDLFDVRQDADLFDLLQLPKAAATEGGDSSSGSSGSSSRSGAAPGAAFAGHWLLHRCRKDDMVRARGPFLAGRLRD